MLIRLFDVKLGSFVKLSQKYSKKYTKMHRVLQRVICQTANLIVGNL